MARRGGQDPSDWAINKTKKETKTMARRGGQDPSDWAINKTKTDNGPTGRARPVRLGH